MTLKGIFFRRVIKKTGHYWTDDLRGLFFIHGHYPTPFLLCQSRITFHTIAIKPRLCHSLANIRNLRYSHAKIRRLCHYCAIGSSLRSYAHDCRHWHIPMEINLFLVDNTKNVQSTCPKAGFTLDPNNFTPKSNNFTPDSKIPSVIPFWFW